MEVGLQVQRSFSYRRHVFHHKTSSKIKPFIGSFPLVKTSHISSITSWRSKHPACGFSFEITASADFSRRRQRRTSTARPNSPAPKGFTPKAPVGASTQKKDTKNNGEEEGSNTATVSQIMETHNIINIGPEKDKKQVAEIPREQKINKDKKIVEAASAESEKVQGAESNQVVENGVISRSEEVNIEAKEIAVEARQSDNMKNDRILGDESVRADERILEDAMKLKLEMEKNLRKEQIERIAEENFSRGSRVFVYPQLVKPDQDIEVFLNRSLSTLKNEPDVLIMGAFNDWRWKSFTFRLNKTHLNGDWWSCLIHVSKEAYKMDFVFHNGHNVYDNNNKKDFCIPVEGGMDQFAFDDFLLEEKCKELQKLAKEQAERERAEEEKRIGEAEEAASEADKAQARAEAAKRREALQQLIKKASSSVDKVWYIDPSEFRGEDMIKVYYNKSSGPLVHAGDIWIHGGYNNWKDGLSIVQRLVSTERKDGDWWFASVVVPDRALVLDWVFADGPPQHAVVYDNNHRQDFHAVVPKSIPEELYWVKEELQIYKKLREERRLKEEAIRAKTEKKACLKAETKERTLKRFLLSQKHLVYTEPLDVQAGSTVTVFYNPANTVLSGKSEVWFRCSFNRWTHRKGPLPPQKMLPSANNSHVKANVKVPLDAYTMDFVFSEREDGGIFDNRDGMDYHIPVFGGIAKEPPMHIVHIAVEMAPIAKVGGLGDVVTSLSRAVQDLNHSVDIILPKYDCLNHSQVSSKLSRVSHFCSLVLFILTSFIY
uniref:starch synthase n=1 Tax=Rhizophora mucronata TaxID=61149 RepID=A0A2P2LB11_RHIMU